jgi:hypothetical protein
MTHGSNDERRRLRALKNFRILDSGREEVFDRIALLAAQLCGTPIGLVSFIDADRQWCKACHGSDMTTIPRDLAFCKRVVEACDLFAVVDTLDEFRVCRSSTGGRKARCSILCGRPVA